MKIRIWSILILSFIILNKEAFAQNSQGIYQTTNVGKPMVLSILEQGELLTGKLFYSDLSSKKFVGRKENSGFVGVLEGNGEQEEVYGNFDKKLLTLNFKAENKTVEMERVSKDLNYDFSKVFAEATNVLKNKIIGVWILKEQYKIENGEKVVSELTGKDYLTAFNSDGKYVIDIRGLRAVEQEAAEELNIPQEYRMKASDFFEASQMMSWKIVGNSIHTFPTKPIPNVPTTVRDIEFQGERMILKANNYDWVEVYVRKE